MSDLSKLLNERIERIVKTSHHIEPDRVPVMGLYQSWALGYSKIKWDDAQNDFNKELEAYGKVLEDFNFDCTFVATTTRATKIFDPLGRNCYMGSEDGYTMQHIEYPMMPDPEEYSKLIENPFEFTLNELLVRKYPNLQKGDAEKYQALKESLIEGQKFMGDVFKGINVSMEKYGMPSMLAGWYVAPVDLLFDYYRGFKGISLDMRRRPDMIIEAADKLADILIRYISGMNEIKGQEFPFLWLPIHLPTFMSAKQFEKLYWPSFKKVIDAVHKMNIRIMCYLEGNWEHLYEFVNQFPKDMFICLLEKDDICKAKKLIGDNVTIAGGMNTEQLFYNSKEQLIEEAKRVVDICAPGGGFIFTTDKILIAPNDVNIDNFRAVNDFVMTYGKY
ncbi:MAG: uroporphyrinogen decarboxylase family protein [Acetobacterium sp.]|uniref:uroporphyrinogen decarboxylase family protein n=1 Tax=Acetobacterium sp. TaxID=1872094 RepID=UPI003242DC06